MDMNSTYSGGKPKKITLAKIREGINIIEASMLEKMVERIEISTETMRTLRSSSDYVEYPTALCDNLFGIPFSVNVDLKVPYRPIYFKGIK